MRRSSIFFLTLYITVAAVAQQQVHTVERGETLSSIANKYGITEYELKKANPNMTICFAGIKLNIPERKKNDEDNTVPAKEVEPVATNNSKNQSATEEKSKMDLINEYPFFMLHYGRGQKYYNQKKWKMAIKELQQAMAEQSYPEEEYQRCEQLLAYAMQEKEARSARRANFWNNLSKTLDNVSNVLVSTADGLNAIASAEERGNSNMVAISQGLIATKKSLNEKTEEENDTSYNPTEQNSSTAKSQKYSELQKKYNQYAIRLENAKQNEIRIKQKLNDCDQNTTRKSIGTRKRGSETDLLLRQRKGTHRESVKKDDVSRAAYLQELRECQKEIKICEHEMMVSQKAMEKLNNYSDQEYAKASGMDYNANNIEHDEFATYSKEAQKNRINAEKEKQLKLEKASATMKSAFRAYEGWYDVLINIKSNHHLYRRMSIKEKRNEIKNAQEKCNEILERYKKNTGERLPVGNADLLKWNPSDKELEEIANR